MRQVMWFLVASAWAVASAAVPALADDPAPAAGLVGRIDFDAAMPQKQVPGMATYIEGLAGLESGKFADAAAAFTKSIQADDEAAMYYTARRRR